VPPRSSSPPARAARRLLLAGLLALPAQVGCGALAPSGCPVRSRIVVLEVEVLPHGRVGETDRCVDPTEVRCLAGLELLLLRRCLVHELAHAVGYAGHEPDPNCYLYESVFPLPLTPPCPQELARMRRVFGTFEVTAATAELHEHVQFAADFWNAHLGRAIFAVAMP
jgi:hypothetical protein